MAESTTWEKTRPQGELGTKKYTVLNSIARQARLRDPRTVSLVSSNVKNLHPKTEFSTEWTTSKSIRPCRTSMMPVRTVQATRDVLRSEQPSWSKVWKTLCSRVRNALCGSEFSSSVCSVTLAGEYWWTISGLTHTEHLTASDKKQKSAMAVKMFEKIEETPSFLNLLWTSDEAHFYLDGKANSKTNVFWGSSSPNEPCMPMHSPISAQCGLQSWPDSSSYNFVLHIKKCTELNGGHLEHMLYNGEKKAKDPSVSMWCFEYNKLLMTKVSFHSDKTLRNGA